MNLNLLKKHTILQIKQDILRLLSYIILHLPNETHVLVMLYCVDNEDIFLNQ